MKISEAEGTILADAFLLAREGPGLVARDELLPEVHRLAEAGWLERHRLDNGDLAWFWSAPAELALELHGLTKGVEGRQN